MTRVVPHAGKERGQVLVRLPTLKARAHRHACDDGRAATEQPLVPAEAIAAKHEVVGDAVRYPTDHHGAFSEASEARQAAQPHPLVPAQAPLELAPAHPPDRPVEKRVVEQMRRILGRVHRGRHVRARHGLGLVLRADRRSLFPQLRGKQRLAGPLCPFLDFGQAHDANPAPAPCRLHAHPRAIPPECPWILAVVALRAFADEGLEVAGVDPAVARTRGLDHPIRLPLPTVRHRELVRHERRRTRARAPAPVRARGRNRFPAAPPIPFLILKDLNRHLLVTLRTFHRRRR
mmetsp:Transcript_22190/g.56660  ORF Transcript_22190/g.56660 Transcript_22190/m.56660 type:complete len:290 (+) Transcript_22190:373-1242(+)